MQYMLTFFHPASEFEKRQDAVQGPAYWNVWKAYVGALYETGKVVSGAGLMPPHTGTSVRIRNGKQHVQDGPYADTKEHLAGYFVIDVPSLDVALEWAARSPSSAAGTTEVRPVMDTSNMK